MNIAEVRDKCKSLVAKIPKDALILSILVLASSTSFGLGYLAGLDTVSTNKSASENSLTVDTPAEGKIVASKSGTKYYLPSCSGAKRISEANKVWFASVSAAETAGYTPAENCDGI